MAGFNTRDEDEVDIDAELDDLERNLKRLRVEYEQYFAGVLKRPPELLQGRVQKAVLWFSGNPPRNTRQKFRFNQLNSRFQVFRQQWGRTMRQIENGTYKPHQFKARAREAARAEDPAAKSPAPERAPAAGKRGAVDQLHDALLKARRKVGDHGPGPDKAALESMVRRQTEAIRKEHGDAKIRFKVVIEGDQAKVKASVSKS